MNLFADITKLPRKLYLIAFLVFIIISGGSFFIGNMIQPASLYVAAITGISFFFAVITLILAFPLFFEWIVDIALVLIAVVHILSIFSSDFAWHLLSTPPFAYILFPIFHPVLFVTYGGWVFFYPYLAYRVSRRIKRKTV